MKHKWQKITTLLGWAALLLLSLACGPVATERHSPFPIPPVGDDDAGSALSRPDRQFAKQAARVNAVVFDSSGQWMATAGDERKITIWNFREGKEIRYLSGHAAPVVGLALRADGKWIVSAGEDAALKIWDVASGQELRLLRGHEGKVLGVAFSPDGAQIASAGADRTVRLWDAETGRALKTLSSHTAGVNSVAYSPDGKTLASGSKDKTVKLWNAETGELLRTLTGHTEQVTSLAFRPDGEVLASGAGSVFLLARRGEYKLWDVHTGREIGGNHLRAPVSALAFRPDGRVLAVAHAGREFLWELDLTDLSDDRLIRHFVAHRKGIPALAFTSDGFWLVSVGADKAIRCWH